MSLNLAERKIQKAFSRVSGQYEDLSGLQARIGEELLEKIEQMKTTSPLRGRLPFRVLDVGTGTARMLPGLQSIFPKAQVIGLDLAFGMLSYARTKYNHEHLIQADASRLPFKDNSFDLIVSNVSYQWVGDLSQAFALGYSVLKPGGVLYVTMFGYETLKELFAALEHTGIIPKDAPRPKLNRLRRWSEFHKAASAAGFKEVGVYHEQRKIIFEDLRGLLRWLKGIGANTLGHNYFVGKEAFKKADAYYRGHFGFRDGVGASFEIIWLKAVK